MVISSPNVLEPDSEIQLTTAMVRGMYLIWCSELRNDRFVETKQFNGHAYSTDSITEGSSGSDSETLRHQFGADNAGWGVDPPDSPFWK